MAKWWNAAPAWQTQILAAVRASRPMMACVNRRDFF
jgi:hypothetical protein